MALNNIWNVTAKDKNGKPVESSPGLTKFQLRGPENINDLRRLAQQLLNVMRQRHFDTYGEDPGYTIDNIEPAGHSDPAVENVGEWYPDGAKPVSLGAVPDHDNT